MPKKGEQGADTAGLLAYLFGPGDRDEHTDPHLITAWDPDLPCPARTPDHITLSALGLLLDAPVDALRGPRPAEHVWHVSIRNAPTDRTLTDTEWATVAAEMVAVAGIAPHGDEHGCRWVAVRHAPDHIHLVATLARRDGRGPRIRGDIPNMHTAARRFETAWGLEPMSPLDETARRAPATGEKEKAARRGLEEPARASLQRTVRQAAAPSATRSAPRPPPSSRPPAPPAPAPSTAPPAPASKPPPAPWNTHPEQPAAAAHPPSSTSCSPSSKPSRP
ncbi:hypothetical protein G3I58_36305, partial [Streptomyces anulatus]|nr:hypothetical protein [Streptomyces anulatus]